MWDAGAGRGWGREKCLSPFHVRPLRVTGSSWAMKGATSKKELRYSGAWGWAGLGAGRGNDHTLSKKVNSGWAWGRGGGTAITQRLVLRDKKQSTPGALPRPK